MGMKTRKPSWRTQISRVEKALVRTRAELRLFPNDKELRRVAGELEAEFKSLRDRGRSLTEKHPKDRRKITQEERDPFGEIVFKKGYVAGPRRSLQQHRKEV